MNKNRKHKQLIEAKPAKASYYLHWLKNYYHEHPDMEAALYLRVSARSQNHNKNLRNQERVLRRRLKKLGIPVADCFSEVISGWVTDHYRGILRQAVRRALQFENTVILAASADRFLRSRDFDTKDNPDALPTIAEFEKLRKITRGVPLVTLLQPNRSQKKVRGYYSKWGQRTKGKKGGRPILKNSGWTIRRREKKLPRVRRLLKKGKNPTEIARKMGIARSSISDWIDN